ncbi:ATP-binding protein [Actinoallomurus sp. NPDC052308]|uniref:ATP-binding protein n=1 Tax=Actinoallomurus sp. NPDC052308 TaxID=3155530 RepID=UPI00342686F6
MTRCVPSPRRPGHIAQGYVSGSNRIEIMPMSSAVADACRAVRDRLVQADPDFTYNVQLVASELATNAIRLVRTQEAPSPRVDPGIWLALEAWARWTHLRVRDAYPSVLPTKRRPDHTEVSGRGVLISESVADYLWVEVSDTDKVVHAVLAMPGVVLSRDDVASFGQ